MGIDHTAEAPSAPSWPTLRGCRVPSHPRHLEVRAPGGAAYSSPNIRCSWLPVGGMPSKVPREGITSGRHDLVSEVLLAVGGADDRTVAARSSPGNTHAAPPARGSSAISGPEHKRTPQFETTEHERTIDCSVKRTLTDSL